MSKGAVELGTALPAELGWDPDALRNFVQHIEELGFGHLTMGDHIIGADPSRYKFVGPFTWREPAHEPFVCLAFIAAVTKRLVLAPGFFVLPARQTVLAAKMAVELDLLSQGRFRFGVGLGAGEGEYEAAGYDFHTRGARLSAQVKLMRRLWSEELLVDVNDGFHTITAGGINPRPKRHIPIWFGGLADRQLRRAAELGDGWNPHFERKDGELFEAVTLGDVVDRSGRYVPGVPAREVVERVHGYLRANGRDPAAFGIQASCPLTGNLDQDLYWAGKWAELGCQFISVSLPRRPMTERLEYLARFKDAWDAR
jgi:probable F420-dependent oxidoreductase